MGLRAANLLTIATTIVLLLSQVCPARPALMDKTLTQDFKDADLVYVVKTLAKEMGCNAYIGPHLEGQVTVSLRSVPPEAALEAILSMSGRKLGYKLPEPRILIVGVPEQLDTLDQEIIRCRIPLPRHGDRVRREFLLSHNDAHQVMKLVQCKHREDAEIIPHPVMNGFYAVGPRSVVSQVGREVREFETNPIEHVDPIEHYVLVNAQDKAELAKLITSLVPEVTLEFGEDDPTRLRIRGLPWDVALAKDLIEQVVERSAPTP